MIYDHYIFGDFIKSSDPLRPTDLDEIFIQANRQLGKIQEVPIERIVDVLSHLAELWLDPDYHYRRLAVRTMPEIVGYSSEMTGAAIDALFENMRRRNLFRILRGHLGRSSYLDRFEYNSIFEGYCKAVPLGVVLHVSPGNVFVGGIDSLMHGFLSKNINILKISRADPIFPLLFAKSLLEVDKREYLSNSFAILNFSGGDEQLTEEIKKSCDGIVVFGGEETVRSDRKNLSLRTRLVEYGPKYSFSIITADGYMEADHEDVFERCARDVIMWEQRACSSPQVIYVEKKIAEDFIDGFPLFLEKVGSEYPQENISFDEKVEVLKAREMARMKEAEGTAILRSSPRGIKWTVIYEDTPNLKESPLNRTVYVKPFSSWDDILKQLVGIRDYLQTTGILATASQIKKFSNALSRIGVSRIVRIGDMFRGKPGAPHDHGFPLRELVKWVSIEWIDKRFGLGDMVAPAKPSFSRWNRLQDLIRFAKNYSQFYRLHLADIMKIENYNDFKKVPFLTKSEIYKNTPPISNDMLTAELAKAYVFASGGSTGEPKFNYYSFRELDRISSILAEIYQIAGITRSDTVANLFMAGFLWTSFIVVNQALEKIGCVSLPIAGNADIDLILHYLKLFRPNAVVGLPSMIIKLAEEIARRGLNITIEKILYGGEHFSPEAIKYLKGTVGARFIRSAGYASVDGGPIGYQCPECKGGVHHLLYSYIFLETIDPKTDRTVDVGEVGEIVVTNFHRRLMPIIRYRTGDLGRVLPYSCACVHKTPLFELLGRSDDILRIGAMSIYPQKIGEALAKLPELSSIFQLEGSYEDVKEVLTVRVETLLDNVDFQGLAKIIRENLIKHDSELELVLREGWLKRLDVEILPPGGIKRNPRTGKIVRVIDRRR